MQEKKPRAVWEDSSKNFIIRHSNARNKIKSVITRDEVACQQASSGF